MGNPEQAGKFALEVAERAQAGFGGVEMVERAVQEVMEFGFRVFVFHGGFEELAAISGQQSGCILPAQAFAPMLDGNLPQGVQLAAPGMLEADFAAEKQVELTRERAFRAACSLGHGFHQAMIRGEPMHDQAGIRQPSQADERCPGGLHEPSIESRARLAMEIRVEKIL